MEGFIIFFRCTIFFNICVLQLFFAFLLFNFVHFPISFCVHIQNQAIYCA